VVTSVNKLGALLLIAVFTLSCLKTVQAYVVDSIAKPSVPEFTVRIVSYPYDVPSKTTTTIDQYTGKETTTTQPGYHVENKSIEIAIKNPQFTPITITEYTPNSHYWYENAPTTTKCNYTTNLYYNAQVKGHFGNDWTFLGGSTLSSYNEGPQSNAQLTSEYTVISIKADYPDGSVLDFQVQALIGFYVPYGRSVVIFGYDFYGQESDWSSMLTLNISETPVSVSPSPTIPSALPSQDSTITPDQTTEPAPSQTTDSNPQQTTQTWQSVAVPCGIVGISVVAAGLLVYFKKRKRQAP
jgi:hypothetical protein